MDDCRSHGNCSSSDKAKILLDALAQKSPLKEVIAALGKGAKVHLVGGVVRDTLCGVEVTDFDIASALAPKENLRLLQHAGIRCIETGIEHGTVLAVVDGVHVEITSFRTPGTRSEFVLSDSISTDLGGRDFTINAIAYDVDAHSFVDPFKGIRDLEGRLLRTVDSAEERFKEDPLRILRMVRFGPAAGREIESATLTAAASLRSSLSKVSPERVRSELEKILLSEHPKEALRQLRDLHLLEIILPEAVPSVGFDQNEFHKEDVYEHTLSVVEDSQKDRIVRLAALFHDLGKPATLSVGEDGRRHFYEHEVVSTTITQNVMERLRFSHEDTHAVKTLVQHHMRPVECGPAGIRRLMRDLGPYFEQWKALKRADKTPTMDLADFEARFRKFLEMVEIEKNRKTTSPFDHLAIDGNDLIALGMKEGKELGQTLKWLSEEIIEKPELNTREQLLEMVTCKRATSKNHT